MKTYNVSWTIEIQIKEDCIKTKQDAREYAKQSLEEFICSEGIPLKDIQVKGVSDGVK